MHSTYPTWQQELAAALTNATELLNYLNIPAHYAACIKKNNIHDPLLKQILPQVQEVI